MPRELGSPKLADGRIHTRVIVNLKRQYAHNGVFQVGSVRFEGPVGQILDEMVAIPEGAGHKMIALGFSLKK